MRTSERRTPVGHLNAAPAYVRQGARRPAEPLRRQAGDAAERGGGACVKIEGKMPGRSPATTIAVFNNARACPMTASGSAWTSQESFIAERRWLPPVWPPGLLDAAGSVGRAAEQGSASASTSRPICQIRLKRGSAILIMWQTKRVYAFAPPSRAWDKRASSLKSVQPEPRAQEGSRLRAPHSCPGSTRTADRASAASGAAAPAGRDEAIRPSTSYFEPRGRRMPLMGALGPMARVPVTVHIRLPAGVRLDEHLAMPAGVDSARLWPTGELTFCRRQSSGAADGALGKRPLSRGRSRAPRRAAHSLSKPDPSST